MNKPAHKLRSALAIRFLLVSAILLIVYTFVWLAITKDQIISAASVQSKDLAEQADMQINNYFSAKTSELGLYTRLDAIENQDITQASMQLGKLLEQDQDIQEASLLSREGMEVVKVTKDQVYSQEMLVDKKDSPEYKIAVYANGSTSVSPVSEGTVLISLPILSGVAQKVQSIGSSSADMISDNITGVLVEKVKLKSLWSQLQTIKNENGHIFIVDKNGMILIHPNRDAFAIGKDMTSMPEVKDFTENAKTAMGVRQTYDELGKQALTYHKYNLLTQWGIISELPLDNILTSMGQLEKFSIVLLGSALLFGLLFILVLYAPIIYTFNRLLYGTNQLLRGNLDYKFHFTTNDEFEEIAASFNKLSSDLQKSYQTVQTEERDVKTEKEQMKQTLMSEEEKMNQVIFTEKEKLTYVLSSVTDAVIILNKNRQVVLMNKVAEDLIGYKATDIVTRPINSFIKLFEKDREIYWDEYASLTDIHQGKSSIYLKQKVRLEGPNISPRIINVISAKAKFSHTEDVGYILVLHNLSETLEVEKTETDFIAAMARELITPLNVIKECLPFVKQSSATVEQGNVGANLYLQGIQIGIDQLSFVLDNLLSTAKIDTGNYFVKLEPVDLIPVVRQTVQDIVPQTMMRQVTLSFSEPTDSMPKVTADVTAVKDVLLNLLMNAISFTPMGGTVTVTLQKTDTDVIVHVHDTGIGIEQESISQLFTKFFRVPNKLVEGQTGAGLGLYIAKSLMELQHGKIWVDSVENRGSDFSFSLQIKK